MKIILKWFILAVAIIFTAWIIPGVEISGVWAALWLALFFGVINITLKPILIILTLPVNILTLGLFTFVINALLIQLSSLVVRGFFVDGFWIAMLFSIALSVISYIFNKFFGLKK
jgi:putative membrane protein